MARQSTPPTYTLTAVDHRGKLSPEDEPSVRVTVLDGLALAQAAAIGAMLIGRPPSFPPLEVGSHRDARAGGFLSVTIARDADA
jgi:hypothetical protein